MQLSEQLPPDIVLRLSLESGTKDSSPIMHGSLMRRDVVEQRVAGGGYGCCVAQVSVVHWLYLQSHCQQGLSVVMWAS